MIGGLKLPNDDCDEKRDTRRLYVPKDKLNLPFFAYDVFKPGEVAFSRIKKFIDEDKSIKDYCVEYPLDIVNGVPFLFKNHRNYYLTQGCLFYFKNNVDAIKAYEIISQAKSYKLYGWTTIDDGHLRMNVLVGRNNIIKVPYHENRGIYYGKEDPMLVRALYTIWNNILPILSNRYPSSDDFFNIQMNYTMLWSSIDRFLVLKFGKRNQQENLKCLVNEKSFKDAVSLFSDKNDKMPTVFSNEDYRTFQLNKEKPLCCIRYYYTIRCNVVHTGKSRYSDYQLLRYAVLELLQIYIYVLRDSFEDYDLFRDIFEEISNFNITDIY